MNTDVLHDFTHEFVTNNLILLSQINNCLYGFTPLPVPETSWNESNK